MACNEPYQNPAGLKFVTRVSIGSDDPRWPAGIAYGEDRLILNIPNGSGPGTVLLQTENCYADWRVVGTKNLVRSTQRAYTGAASWEEVWLEDGGNIYGRVQDVSQFSFNTDGLVTAANGSTIKALWFPNSARIPTFDRLSIVSGPITPAAAGGFPFRSVADDAEITIVPPGLCRYFQVSIGQTGLGTGTFDLKVVYDVANTAEYWSVSATSVAYGFCPAWGSVWIKNTSGSLQNMSLCWNRFPMTGT